MEVRDREISEQERLTTGDAGSKPAIDTSSYIFEERGKLTKLSDGIYLTIENQEALVRFVKGCVRNGYMRRFDLREVTEWIKTTEYPIRIPVNLNSVIGVGSNVVVKGIFGNNIEKTITKYMKGAMGIE